MSAEELSKLSLGDNMVTTRAGAARAQTAPPPPREHSHSPSPSPSPSTPLPAEPVELSNVSSSASPAPSLIESASGLKYNVSLFDADVRTRAKRGLMDDNAIKMKYCRLSEDDENDKWKYMFYIDDDIQVAMGGRYDAPSCTCGANEGGKACKHIFWMLDQLTTGAPARVRSQTLELSADGSSVQHIQPAKMIDEITLERVAEGLDWVLHDGPLPEDEEIEDEMAEMLSVFEPSNALPAELKNPGSAYLSEQSQKFREFMELLIQCATENPGFFSRLQTIIEPAFQGHVFFEKINNRIVRTFRGLDEYIEKGPTDAPSESYDVKSCARKLTELVKAIDDYYHQKSDDPKMKATSIRAAAALIMILDGVTSRNFDAYANITWDGVPPLDPKENNLFVCLIGESAEQEGLFVLDTLKTLPQDDVLRNHSEVLFTIGERLSQQRTPIPFMNAFHGITTENRKRAGAEIDGSSAKRPMQ